MKKLFFILLAISFFITGFIIIKKVKNTNKSTCMIGILQTASHPALDAVRTAFVEELKSTQGSNCAFVIQNAQGSVANTHTIAQQFHANKQFVAFFAIGTPAAQALASVEKEKPIVIAAVSDPKMLGHQKNITGVTDMINVTAEIDLIKQLVPKAKTVGILYTSGEVNSIALVKRMHQELQNRRLSFVDFSVSGESDIPAATELACRKSDVVLTPTDNTVASSIALIATIAQKYDKPLIVSDNMLVKFGALAARGIDYTACGVRAAQLTFALIAQGKKPSELPIEQGESNTIVINKQILEQLHLVIPEIMKNSPNLIYE